MPTGATMFSGGGVAEALLKTSVDIRWAIEYDPAIAAVYRRNIGDHIIVGDVRHQDYGALGYVDWLHASPVCTRASVANTGAVESDLDIEMAQAVVRALEAVQPRAFTLENVWGYRTFQAFRRICQALDALGYWYSYEHLNSADFGVPQTRRRLILRATRDRLLPTLPEPTPWRGWYEAIEDLIPTLPETQFAPWQIDRLTAHGAETVLIGGNRSQSFLDFALKHRPTIPSVFSRHEPSFAISSTASSDARAFIVDGQAADHGARVTTRPGDAPMFTVNAQAGARQALRAWLVSNAATEYSDGLRADAESKATTANILYGVGSGLVLTGVVTWLVAD